MTFSPRSFMLFLSLVLSLGSEQHEAAGSGCCWWRDGVTQAGHVGRRPLSSTCLSTKLTNRHPSTPLPLRRPCTDTGRNAATSPHGALHHSVTACQLRSPSPAHRILMFSILGCARLQNPAMWHQDNFTFCILCFSPITHTNSFAKPLSSKLVTAAGCDNEWVTVGRVMGWGRTNVYVQSPSSADHLSTASSSVWVTGCQCQASKTPSPTITVRRISATQITAVHMERKTGFHPPYSFYMYPKCFTFTCVYLADAVIQSDLQCTISVNVSIIVLF